MKTISVCVLLFLLSIGAYSQIAVALNGGGVIASDASSGRQAPGSRPGDNQLAAGLSEYVFLHKTRNERMPLQVAAGANVCPK